MRKSGSRLAIISVLLLGAIVFGLVYFAWNTTLDIFQQPLDTTNTAKTIAFTINPDDTATTIADHLQKQGIIRNALAFRLWARIKGLDTHFEAGVYNLSPGSTISKITDQLLNAQPDATVVLIPEGLRIEQIAQRFTDPVKVKPALVKFNAQDFLKYTKHVDQFPDAGNYPFLKSIPQGQGMEGFLYPATYEVPVNATARDVVNQILTAMKDIIQKDNLETIGQQHKLTLYQVVILASLVEREVVQDKDRGGVASVYWNRIEKQNNETVGFLNSDPSVMYARDTQNPPQKYWADLIDSGGNVAPTSPWNTYTHQGWTPTPICNPGERSLLAAANPPPSDNYFFLGVPGDGHIVYAKTKADFDKLVAQYLHK